MLHVRLIIIFARIAFVPVGVRMLPTSFRFRARAIFTLGENCATSTLYSTCTLRTTRSRDTFSQLKPSLSRIRFPVNGIHVLGAKLPLLFFLHFSKIHTWFYSHCVISMWIWWNVGKVEKFPGNFFLEIFHFLEILCWLLRFVVHVKVCETHLFLACCFKGLGSRRKKKKDTAARKAQQFSFRFHFANYTCRASQKTHFLNNYAPQTVHFLLLLSSTFHLENLFATIATKVA